MELLGFLTFCILSVSANNPFDDNENQVHGQNGWYVPSVDGTFYWIHNNVTDMSMDSWDIIEQIEMLTSPVTYHLYTRQNPTIGNIITTTMDSLELSNFDVSKPTYIIIHGWTQSYQTNNIQQIAHAALGAFDCNAIVIDWPRARSRDFVSSFAAVPGVGKQLADMIDFLRKFYQMPLENLVIVGHSLGAHVAGYAGKNVESGKLSKIIALDAALPLYSYDKPQKRLAVTDADYVQVIHTSAGKLGFVRPIGHGDFYPNGGQQQPGCDNEIFGFCSHEQSTQYYAEALALDNFATIKCENYQQALNRNCGNIFSSVRMGAVFPGEEASGIYYVPVRNNTPYGVLNNTDGE
ncbi:phospholipase A1-like [Musca autumnalis]|uniref:phospholipase A1-like n=1 Tax=Musca autumnalis TaxID=221902 RepID=UPI003CF81498